MYLDIVMIYMCEDIFLVYLEVVCKDVKCWILIGDEFGVVNVKEEGYFVIVIEKVFGVDKFNLIIIGGDNFNVECEQWNDVNNVLIVKFGVVIGYEGNIYINEKYDKVGIIVLLILGDEFGCGCGGVCCMSCLIECDGI